MRALAASLLFALAATSGVYADTPGWTVLHQGGLTLSAPAGTTLEKANGLGPPGWRLRNPLFMLEIFSGPSVADGDDGEPRLCYTTWPIAIDGRAAILRVAKPSARLDCPETYASLYLAPTRPAGDALYVWGLARSQDDLATVGAVLQTVRVGEGR